MAYEPTTDHVMQALADALYASVTAGDGHYSHWDAHGTAGANCPACQARWSANQKAYAALRRARDVGIIPAGALGDV